MKGVLVLLWAGAVHARPELVAAPGHPTFDGKLDDDAWRGAPATSAFTQKFPSPGAAPGDVTTVRVLYDREALWVGFDCRQSVPVVATLTRRDRRVEADTVEVALDTRDDGTSAFVFWVNAAGVIGDGLRFDDTNGTTDWDENWDARVHKDAHGWTAELRIPLRILRFDRLPVQDWGMQLRRYVSGRQETDEWAYIPPTEAGEVSHYGRLRALYNLKPPGPFELRPFVLGRVRHRDAASSMLASGWDVGGSIGADVKWHLTQNLTLDATFNPDFAQVEADQVVLNLTNFEIYFPEKRPFFLEGIDAFATPLSVLYTRRIGLAPPVPALRTDAPFGEQLVDVPDATTIYGAGKLVGTLGKRWTVAALSALTARNQIEAQLADGHRQHFTAEPMTLYDVLRVKYSLGNNSHIGFIGTAVDRFEAGRYPVVPAAGTSPTYALCPDGNQVNVQARCFHDAYLAGVDFRWRSRGGEWVALGQALLSGMAGGPSRTQLDGTAIGAGDLGGGGYLYLAREGGRHWLFGAQYDAASARLDYNDLGYQQRQNYHHLYAWLAYRTTEKHGLTLNTRTQLQYDDTYNLAGLNLGHLVQLYTTGHLTSLWAYWAELHYKSSRFDDREVGDGTALERDGLVGGDLWIGSDSRKRLYFEWEVFPEVLFNGWHVWSGGRFVLRALPRLDFELVPAVEYSTGEPRYAGAGTAPGSYLFGRLEALSVAATLRATFTFTPRLSLSVYTQLFLASKHYHDFFVFAAGRGGQVVHLDDLRPITQRPPTNPDAEEAALNVNVVLRWEYRLGSTLFFVYSRGQTPGLTLSPAAVGHVDINDIGRAPAADVLLVKLSYWWG